MNFTDECSRIYTCEESRTEQRKEFNCNAISTKTSAMPQSGQELRWPFRIAPL